MSGRREVTYKGQNAKGNDYTVYSDGAFAYKNNSDNARYYNDGHGHGFYNSKEGNQGSGGVPYKAHYNYNQGFATREYQQKK